jgi:hypothetical protein
MPISSISLAQQRQADRPDIHKSIVKPRGSIGYDDSAMAMVLDLKDHVQELSNRQLSSLTGISEYVVRKMLGVSETPEHWSFDNNEASSAAELAALKYCYPGRQYEDDTENEFGETSTPFLVIIAAPAFADSGIKADQSHTIKRPITLATSPFDVEA